MPVYVGTIIIKMFGVPSKEKCYNVSESQEIQPILMLWKGIWLLVNVMYAEFEFAKKSHSQNAQFNSPQIFLAVYHKGKLRYVLRQGYLSIPIAFRCILHISHTSVGVFFLFHDW